MISFFSNLWSKIAAVGLVVLGIAAAWFKWRAEANAKKAKRQQQRADSLDEKVQVSKAVRRARSKVRQEAADHEAEKQEQRDNGDRPTGNFGDRL